MGAYNAPFPTASPQSTSVYSQTPHHSQRNLFSHSHILVFFHSANNTVFISTIGSLSQRFESFVRALSPCPSLSLTYMSTMVRRNSEANSVFLKLHTSQTLSKICQKLPTRNGPSCHPTFARTSTTRSLVRIPHRRTMDLGRTMIVSPGSVVALKKTMSPQVYLNSSLTTNGNATPIQRTLRKCSEALAKSASRHDSVKTTMRSASASQISATTLFLGWPSVSRSLGEYWRFRWSVLGIGG